jgi:hypothetical protein
LAGVGSIPFRGEKRGDLASGPAIVMRPEIRRCGRAQDCRLLCRDILNKSESTVRLASGQPALVRCRLVVVVAERSASLRPGTGRLVSTWETKARHVSQSPHVSNVARSLHGEYERLRHRIVPSGETVRALKRIEGSVDLDGGKLLRGKAQLVLPAQRPGIEFPPPGRVAPSRNADADFGHLVARTGGKFYGADWGTTKPRRRCRCDNL